MVARNRGRYLAPIALIVTVVVAIVIISSQLGTKSRPARSHTVRGTTTRHGAPVKPQRTFYVVQPGDSFSTISAKTGVSIATLEALNPSADPSALQTGQRLKLR